jgi:hypothetical protein
VAPASALRQATGLIGAAALAAVLALAHPAHAENFFDNYYPGFFTLQTPGTLNTIMFGGGFISDQYGAIQEGVQFEQSITPYIGAFGRVTGYQLFIGHGFSSPLNPTAGVFPRLNFGRLQGGADFTLYPGTHLFISGGKDVGDSDAAIIEGDFSSWWFVHSFHPLNFSFSAMHDYQNGVTSTSIDLQAIALSTEKWMFLLGGGGSFYAGGFLSDFAGQGGPDLGVYYRPWALGFSAQAGYGTARQYGQISFYKQLRFIE